MQQSLDDNQRSTSSMLKSLLTGEYGCPRYLCILPKEPAAGWGRKLLELSKPTNWLNKEMTLHFVCPVTLQCAGEGYALKVAKDWVTKYGPALRVGLQVLKVREAPKLGQLSAFL
jgi:hypothetical protein